MKLSCFNDRGDFFGFAEQLITRFSVYIRTGFSAESEPWPSGANTFVSAPSLTVRLSILCESQTVAKPKETLHLLVDNNLRIALEIDVILNIISGENR